MVFIRPLLLCLLFVPFLFRFIKRTQLKNSPWVKWIDKDLLPYLLVQSAKETTKALWSKSLMLLWCLFVVAAAGPACQKLPTPVSFELPNTVFILDLGPVMQPSALASAKIKLNDFLTALKGNRVGLVLYADKGYTALPLTPDRSLLRSLIPMLDASILPNPGQNLAQAFRQANDLIKQTGNRGRILYLTAGGVDAKNVQTPYPVGVLGLDDKAVSAALKNLGAYHAKTADAADIFALLQQTEPEAAVAFNEEEQVDEWADLGALISLILLPFFALTFRKGFVFILLLVVFQPVHASFFLRPDQEAYQQHEQAVIAYRSGHYDQAIQGFQNEPYNLGNALAHSGQIQEAIQAYAQALEAHPDDEDARFNKEYLEKQLPPPEENQQNKQDTDQKKDKSDSQEESDAQNQEQPNSDSKNDDNSLQDQQTEQQGENNQQQQSELSASSDAQELSTQERPQEVNEQDREESPFNQQEQQVLNRLRTDPYRVLRYRLLQQARQK